MLARKLRDFEVTKVAAQAVCQRETVRRFFLDPDRMKPATRARVETALRELGFLAEAAQR
jgi:DNA-binding LacI/PurR family transcriptional regulator